MSRFGFCGPTYNSQSPNVDAERAINFYPEAVEAQFGKTGLALMNTPGLVLFCTLMGSSIRGFISVSEPAPVNQQGIFFSPSALIRVFAVSGTKFYEIFQDGTFTDRSGANIFAGTGMASMAASPTQILIVDGGQGYCYNLATNTFQTLQTFSPGTGAISAPFSVAAGGQGYLVNDIVSPVGSGTGGSFKVTAVSPPGTVNAGLLSGLILSGVTANAPTAPGLTAGTLEAQSSVIVLSGPQDPGIPPSSVGGTVSYLFYNSITGFYYSLSPTAATPGDAYVGALIAFFTPASFGGPSLPQTEVEGAGPHTGWTSIGNLGGGGVDTITLFGSNSTVNTSRLLTLTNFGFVIPADASIQSIQCEVDLTQTGGTSATFIAEIELVGVTSPVPQNQANLGVNKFTLACTNPTPAQINASGFGVVLELECTQLPGTGATLDLTAVTLTINYSPNASFVINVLSQPTYGTSSTTTPGGAVLSISLNAAGTGYVPSQNDPTTGGTGSGLEVNFATTDIVAGSGMISNPILCVFIDGFFIVLKGNSQEIQASQLEDASTWDPTQVAQVSVFKDNVVSMLADHRQLWLWGSQQSQVYYDSGNVFPFDPIPGAFIEQGSGAVYAPVRLDNSVMWIGEDERGARVAWRANGYTPARISNHSVEWRWGQYSTIADAIGYSWQWQGHSFWQIYFPTAGETWVYDAATGMWHERTSFNMTAEIPEAHWSQCHVFAWGIHLLGDRKTGNVYRVKMPQAGDPPSCQENGAIIQRVRISPYVFREHTWIRHHMLELDVEVGLGPQPPLLDGAGNPRDPQLLLQWADDQAKVYSFGRVLNCGKAGTQGFTRVYARMLGRSRGRVYKVTCTDPVPWRFADAYLNATPNFGVQERLSAQIGKMG